MSKDLAAPMLFTYAATEYWEASTLIHEAVLTRAPERRPLPFYTNCGLSIELSYKGYLRARGRTIDEIKAAGGRGGHNLMDLMSAANNAADQYFLASGGVGAPPVFVPMSVDDFKLIANLNHYYRMHTYRYPEAGVLTLMPMENCLGFAKRLLDVVAPICKENNTIHFGKPSAETSPRTGPVPFTPMVE